MTSNEKKKSEAFSRWCNGSQFYYDRLPRSHYLQTNNLSEEYEKKIEAIVRIIEEDGDTFAKRAEMYYEQRPQLLKLIGELHKSYTCLALRYDQLCSQIPMMPMSASSSSALMIRPLIKSKPSQPQRVEEKTPQTVFEREMIEKRTTMSCSGDFSDEKEKEWSEKRVSELIEDHVRYQIELVRKNESKREKIRELQLQVHKLMNENKALKASINGACCVKPVNRSNEKPKATLCRFRNLSGCAG